MLKNKSLKASIFDEEYFACQINEERAAIFLQVSLSYLQSMRKNHKGPCWSYSDKLKPVYRRGDLVSWLKSQKSKKERRFSLWGGRSP